jgi:ATP-dependent helicase/nuclease subunit A
VYDVLNLLRAVVSSIDNLSLAGALRSPLFALTDETLYWLVEAHGSLQQAIAVAEPPAQLDPLEASKFRRACATLAALRTQKDRLLVADLLQEAVARTGYDAALLAEFLGQRKLANLEKLLEQARELDRVSPGDLNGFITQLSEFVHRPPKEALAAVQAEGDVVRLMTIHNAKGLEFPVVVLGDMGRGYAANRGEATLDREFGPVLPESGKENRVARSGWSLFKLREDREEAAERLRLLYVACTRAADYLILSAPYEDACGAPGGKQNDWLRLLAQRYDLQTGAWEGPVAPDSATPAQVRVTVSEPTGGRAPLGRPRGTDVLQVVAEAQERAATARRPPASAEPLGVAQRWRRGFSFSRLTGELLREDEEGAADPADAPSNPRASAAPVAAAARSFADGDDALDLGRIVHRALERLDFANPTDAARLCREAADMRRVPQLAEPAAEMLERFLAGPRVRQLAAARRVLREAPFLLPWSLPGDDGPPRRLEGVIDCLYLDATGQWRLIDYKTNRIRPSQAAAAAARYELQLFVYAEAARQALGAPLAEVALCFLGPGVEHAFQWDAQASESLSRKITKAMQSLLKRVDPC